MKNTSSKERLDWLYSQITERMDYLRSLEQEPHDFKGQLEEIDLLLNIYEKMRQW